jgi:hypothetical protein
MCQNAPIMPPNGLDMHIQAYPYMSTWMCILIIAHHAQICMKHEPFLACLNFFWSAQNFAQNSDCPWFFLFHRLSRLTPPSPFSFPPSFKFLLDGFLELERSPFKIETFFSIFSTYWEQIARFWVQNSYFIPIYFNVWYVIEVILMECKSIHGNLWNLWMKWSSSNAVYGFVFYPWSV